MLHIIREPVRCVASLTSLQSTCRAVKLVVAAGSCQYFEAPSSRNGGVLCSLNPNLNWCKTSVSKFWLGGTPPRPHVMTSNKLVLSLAAMPVAEYRPRKCLHNGSRASTAAPSLKVCTATVSGLFYSNRVEHCLARIE